MMALLFASAISDSTLASVHNVPSGIVTLGDAALRALLVACAVGAGLRILAPRHVPAQKTGWGLVLAGALLMPIVAPWAGHATWLPTQATFVVPAHTWSEYVRSRVAAFGSKTSAETPYAAPAPGPAAAAKTSFAPDAAAAVERIDVSQPASQANHFPAPTISQSQTVGTEPRGAGPFQTRYYLPLSDFLWMIYGSVALALLLRLFYGLGGAIGLWQSAEPVPIDARLAGGLRLRSSPKISSPVTIGSAVVLPADYDEWDASKLRIVLAHERSHVRQGDFYLQALAGLYSAIFWFSPLGWWLKRKLSDLSEAISDHAGLEEAASHASYAQILLEFAALPRRTQVGVAMAHAGRISQRIERLLNEHNFRQAFAGGRRRLWATLLLVPAILFAAAALIRVQAAQTLQHPVNALGPIVGQSHPESAPDAVQAPAAAPTPAPAPDAEAPEDPTEAQAPAPATPEPPPSAPDVAAPAAPDVVPVAPIAPPVDDADQDPDQTVTTTENQCKNGNSSSDSSRANSRQSKRHGYSYAYSSNGDSYAVISGNNGDRMSFSGDWYEGRRAEVAKARAMAHGDFLWFSRGGKSYIVDDAKTVAQIRAMYKPMEELGQKQEELGRQQAVLGRQQEEMGRRQEQASIPTPDIAREMAELNAATAKLQARKGSTVTIDELAELQSKIGELQGKLGGLEGQIGDKQGELGRLQGELGEQQGKLGERQGQLGEEQGRLAREADSKVKSMIDESLKDGKARPVQ